LFFRLLPAVSCLLVLAAPHAPSLPAAL